MKILNYEGMAKLCNTSPNNFLKMSKRWEQKVIDCGIEFKKNGKGKESIYEVWWKNFNDMDYGQRFYFLFEEFPTNNDISEKYFELMWRNYKYYKYLTDKQLCKYLFIDQKFNKRIERVRKQLVKLELMIDIKLNKSDSKYYKIDYKSKKRIEIKYSEYAELLEAFLFYKRHLNQDLIDGDERQKFENAYMLIKTIKGVPIKIHGRIMTRKFFVLSPYLLGEKEMSEDQQKAYEIYGYDETFFKEIT